MCFGGCDDQSEGRDTTVHLSGKQSWCPDGDIDKRLHPKTTRQSEIFGGCPHCASSHVIAGKEAWVIIMQAEELPVPDLLDASGLPEQELLSHSS
jgi:hypothetical protein